MRLFSKGRRIKGEGFKKVTKPGSHNRISVLLCGYTEIEESDETITDSCGKTEMGPGGSYHCLSHR